MEKINSVTIVGLGLIGGSIGLQIKKHNWSKTILGVEKKPNHIKLAKQLKLANAFVSLETGIKKSNLIILAIPVDQIKKLLPFILNNIGNHQFVMDVGSTKLSILQAIENHPKRNHYIATHPMWGTEFSGPVAATLESFKGKKTIICDPKQVHHSGLELVRSFYKMLEMEIVYMTTTAHDESVAYISHISHISSFALANTTLIKEKKRKNILNLASSGFESTVRLAKSNPKTWSSIFLENKDNVIKVLDEYIHQLEDFKSKLDAKNARSSLQNFMQNANKIKKILK